MNSDYIKTLILQVYTDCSIRSFPIDCIEILEHYKAKVYPYSVLDDPLRNYCFSYSEDALNYKGKVCFNDKMPKSRIRFSLMHELGHIILRHGEEPTPDQEKEADFFASHILAPRMAIHYSRCKNENDVAKLFQLSQEAARYAFDDYRRWHRWTEIHKMNLLDKAMYAHFYSKDRNCFVYSIKRCPYCDTLIYNSSDILCGRCKTPRVEHLRFQPPEEDLLIARSQWLYGGL